MDKLKLRVEYKSRQSKGPPDSVDIGRSVLVCNIFIFLFSAAKASLFPFLTLYMRFLGFSASQTGLIMGGKTGTALVMAPLWARCAGKHNKRKCMLMFSVLMLAAVYLSLTLIPSVAMNGHLIGGCGESDELVKFNWSTVSPQMSESQQTTLTTAIVSSKDNDYAPSSNRGETTAKPTPVTASTSSSPSPEIQVSASVSSGITEITPKNYKLPESVLRSTQRMLEKLRMKMSDLAKMTPKKIKQVANSIPEGHGLYILLKNLTPHEITLLIDLLQKELPLSEYGRQPRDTWAQIKSKMAYLKDRMLENVGLVHSQLFLIVVLILIIGEIFCSPVEKIADDAWYDFLDEVDGIEKYGRQRLLTSCAFILFPILTTLLVDYTPCFLGESINHLSIHFYAFGGCLGLTFVVALFYPIPTPGKRKYMSKVIKGFRVLCCNGRNFIYILTLLVLGCVYSTSNYLFWVVQDLGGQELPMGVAVAVAAFSEFPMLMFSDKIVNKLSHSGVIAMAMAFLSVRQLYYSFLWVNWAVVPIEALHAFTHTAMWWAMLSNPDFSVSAPVDRSIRSILSSLYFGVGYGIGSVASGFVYEEFGYSILYRASAILTASWMILFVLINCCIPAKRRIRYSKLLQAEDGNLSDSSNEFEEDWLEQALRDH